MDEAEATRIAEAKLKQFEAGFEELSHDATKAGRTLEQIARMKEDYFGLIRREDFRSYLHKVCRALVKAGWAQCQKADVIDFILRTWPICDNPNKVANSYWMSVLHGQWVPQEVDGPEKAPEVSEEYVSGDEDLVDQIIEEGEVVFTHDWDSGAPLAGAGSEEVYKLGGKYAVYSVHRGQDGPFDSLEAALAHWQLLLITSATAQITCNELSSEELAKQLTCDQDECEFDLNDQRWSYRRGSGFKRKRKRRKR